MAAAELQTPKMPSHQPSPRNRAPTRYRKEIERVKSIIASTEKGLISLQEVIKLRNDQSALASDLALATAIMQQMTLETQEVHTTREQLTLNKQRLVQLEEKLRRTEEEAEKSARGMLHL
jgi:ribosomal protein S30